MPSDGHVGPVIFSDRTARGQLLTHGEVVTFRATDRTTGETWWRESRTGPKRGDCRIERIEGVALPLETSNLTMARHVECSGFVNVARWQDAIREHHGEATKGWLYRVTALQGECGRCGETAPLPTNTFCPPCSRAEAADLRQSRAVPK